MSSTPPQLGPWPDDDEPAKRPPSTSDAVIGVVSGLGFSAIGTFAAGFFGVAHGGGYSIDATVLLVAVGLAIGLMMRRHRRVFADGFFVGVAIGLVGLYPCLASVTSSNGIR